MPNKIKDLVFDVNTRLSMLKSSAKARGLYVNLDLNKYQVLINCGCHYCGLSLKEEKGYCLDRIDSNRNYVISNVLPCCKICNRAKSNMDYHDFINWLDRANSHMKKQIKQANELQSLGLTKEMYIELENAFYRDQNRGKDKNRMEFSPTKNK